MSSAPSSVGGFFPLELGAQRGELPPDGTAWLRSGRACLRLLLEQARPSRIFVPFYICNAALTPAQRLGIPLTFYALDPKLRPILPQVTAGDVLLAVDYFGLCGAGLAHLAELGERLILDQTHALFAEAPATVWRFTSARKWFGVPDGAFLAGPRPVSAPEPAPLSMLPAHLVERRWGDPARAYQAFLDAEARFDDEVAPISAASVELLCGVDTEFVRQRRRENFRYLAERLGSYNVLDLPMNARDVPFCYPFLPELELGRETLAENSIFVPRFWQDCLDRGDPTFAWEAELTRRLLPLPVDHRYSPVDMQRVAEHVLSACGQARAR